MSVITQDAENELRGLTWLARGGEAGAASDEGRPEPGPVKSGGWKVLRTRTSEDSRAGWRGVGGDTHVTAGCEPGPRKKEGKGALWSWPHGLTQARAGRAHGAGKRHRAAREKPAPDTGPRGRGAAFSTGDKSWASLSQPGVRAHAHAHSHTVLWGTHRGRGAGALLNY